jgi:hypothetical protein
MGFMWAFTWPNAFRACDAQLPQAATNIIMRAVCCVRVVFAQDRRGEERGTRRSALARLKRKAS